MRVLVDKITETGRKSALELLHRELGAEVTLLHDSDGAPILGNYDLHITISHSRHWVAVGLHPTMRIGVDIEEPRPEQLQRVQSKFLSASEHLLWADRLLEAWTCKEAVYKAAGTPGLPLADIDLTRFPNARIPDGRTFLLNTVTTPDYTLTTACQIPS